MTRLYLMQRFDMSENFPNGNSQGIEPYIASSFVLFHEDGTFIPLEKNGFGNANGLSSQIAQRLKRIQDSGFQISGEVHPSYREPINIEGDMEIYNAFPAGSAEESLLKRNGVSLHYR